MTHVSGPDFLSIQVRDLQRSAGFYERELGLQPMAGSPPGVVAFQTSPIPFAVREPLPGTDLDAGPAGLGVLLSLRADDAQALHDQLKTHSVPILTRTSNSVNARTCKFVLALPRPLWPTGEPALRPAARLRRSFAVR